jgi:predicted Zn-dependent protease
MAMAQDANVLAGESYLRRGEFGKAAEALELALKVAPKSDAQVYVMLAVARLNMRDAEGAVRTCESGLEHFPASEWLSDLYISVLPRVLPPAEVIKRLEAQLARSPQSPLWQKAVGKAMIDARSEDARAGELLASARKARPSDPEAQFLYGQWACLHQKEAECVAALRKSLAMTPATNHAAHLLANGMIGVAEDRLNRPAQARAAFDSALKAYGAMQPPVPHVPYQYVRFLLSKSDDAAARKVNAEILRRNPEFAPARIEHARFLFSDGKAEEAAAEAEAALKGTAPEDRTQLRGIHSFLVKAYAALGRDAEAEAHQKWVDENPR